MHTHESDAAKKIGMTNLQIAENRRRIAELRWEIAGRRNEIATLENALQEDKKNFPR